MNLFSDIRTPLYTNLTQLQHDSKEYGDVAFSIVKLGEYAKGIQERILACENFKNLIELGVSDIVDKAGDILEQFHFPDVEFSMGLSLEAEKMSLDVYARDAYNNVRFMELNIPLKELAPKFYSMVYLVRLYDPSKNPQSCTLGRHHINDAPDYGEFMSKVGSVDPDIIYIKHLNYSVRHAYKNGECVKAIFVGKHLIDYID